MNIDRYKGVTSRIPSTKLSTHNVFHVFLLNVRPQQTTLSTHKRQCPTNPADSVYNLNFEHELI